MTKYTNTNFIPATLVPVLPGKGGTGLLFRANHWEPRYPVQVQVRLTLGPISNRSNVLKSIVPFCLRNIWQYCLPDRSYCIEPITGGHGTANSRAIQSQQYAVQVS